MTMLTAALAVLLGLHVVALHTSIAGMEIVSSLIAALALAGVLKDGFTWRPDDKRLMALLAAFTLWVGLSLLVNPPAKPFWFQFGFMRWILVLLALVVAVENAWSPPNERRLIWLWSICTIITGAYAMFQSLTGIDFIRHGAVSAQGGGTFKAVGFFSISLTFAYVFGILAFAIAGPAWRERRALGLLTIICGAGGVLASMSRGAWLAALASAFFFLLLKQRRLVLPVLAVVGAAVGALIWQGGGFATKITQMAELHVDHSSAVRLDVWRGYWRMFLDHPLFGVGIFSGDTYLPEIYARLGITQPFVSHAHNNLLQFLAGTGVLGLIIYVVVCGAFLRKAWRLTENTRWGWSLLLAQVFLQLGGLTECNFIDGEVTHALVLCWALTWVLERKLEQQLVTFAATDAAVERRARDLGRRELSGEI